MAELHRIESTSAPSLAVAADGTRTSKDPSTVVRRSLRWERAAIPEGSWRVYSSSDPDVELTACPAG